MTTESASAAETTVASPLARQSLVDRVLPLGAGRGLAAARSWTDGRRRSFHGIRGRHVYSVGLDLGHILAAMRAREGVSYIEHFLSPTRSEPLGSQSWRTSTASLTPIQMLPASLGATDSRNNRRQSRRARQGTLPVDRALLDVRRMTS